MSSDPPGDPRGLRDHGRVDIDRRPPVLAEHLKHTPQEDLRIDVAPRGIRVGEEISDVGQAGGPEEGVADRVRDAVGVAVAFQPEFAVKANSAQDEGPAGYGAVDVVPVANSKGHADFVATPGAGANRNSR